MPRAPRRSRSTKMFAVVLFLGRTLREANPPGASVRTSSVPLLKSTAFVPVLMPKAPPDCTRTVPLSKRTVPA